MQDKLKTIAVAIAAVGTLSTAFLPSSTWAATRGEVTVTPEMQSCLDAVNSQIETSDAERVSHVVSRYRAAKLGYTMQIDTTVNVESGDKTYRTICSANDAYNPYRLRVRAIAE